jgi:hypothetical protein
VAAFFLSFYHQKNLPYFCRSLPLNLRLWS